MSSELSLAAAVAIVVSAIAVGFATCIYLMFRIRKRCATIHPYLEDSSQSEESPYSERGSDKRTHALGRVLQIEDGLSTDKVVDVDSLETVEPRTQNAKQQSNKKWTTLAAEYVRVYHLAQDLEKQNIRPDQPRCGLRARVLNVFAHEVMDLDLGASKLGDDGCRWPEAGSVSRGRKRKLKICHEQWFVDAETQFKVASDRLRTLYERCAEILNPIFEDGAETATSGGAVCVEGWALNATRCDWPLSQLDFECGASRLEEELST